MLELFWSNMLELFCDKKTCIILGKMLEFFHIKSVFIGNFSTNSSMIANFAQDILVNIPKICQKLELFPGSA